MAIKKKKKLASKTGKAFVERAVKQGKIARVRYVDGGKGEPLHFPESTKQEVVIEPPIIEESVEYVRCRYCGRKIVKPSDSSTFYQCFSCPGTGEHKKPSGGV